MVSPPGPAADQSNEADSRSGGDRDHVAAADVATQPDSDADGGRTAASRRAASRRGFLARLSAVGSGIALAGCGGRTAPATNGGTDGAGGGTDGTESATADLGPAPPLVGPWPQARADAANTGAVESTAPTNDPSLRWETTAAGAVGAAVGVPGGSGPSASFQTDDSDPEAAAYVVAEDGRVAAVDADGDVRWRAAVGDGLFPPAAGSGRVVVPARDRLVVLDADTGESLRAIDVPDGTLYSPTLYGDLALVGTFSGGVVAVDLASGERRWQVGEPSRAYPPVVVDGVAYATARQWSSEGESGSSEDGSGSGTDEAGVLVAIDVESGEQRWERRLDGFPTAPPGVHDGVVYAGTHRGTVHAVGTESGEEHWRESVGDWVTRGPTAAADGIYVVVLGEGPAKLTRDGSVAWRVSEDERPDLDVGTNPVLTAEAALFGGHDGVVALNRDDGAVRWRAATDGPVRFDVRVDGSTAYAADQYGSVVAVDAASGAQRWRLPFRPPTMPGPVVGPRTVAGASRDGLTYDLQMADGLELSTIGNVGGTNRTPAFLGDAASGGGSADSPRETLLCGGSDGTFARVRTIDYGDAPATDLPPTSTPTATPGPGDPTASPTPHIDFPKPETLWGAALDVEPRSPITYAAGWGYVGTSEGVAAVDARTGDLRFRRDLGAVVTGAPAAVDGRVFVATRSGRLVALDVDAATGGGSVASAEVAWEASLDAGARAGPAVDGGSVFAADESGTITAVGVDGDPRWTESLDGAVHGGVALTARRVFVGTDAGEVVALNREDGAVDWRTPAEGAVRATPAVGLGSGGSDGASGSDSGSAGGSDGGGDGADVGAGTVYAADHAGTLSAFDAGSGTVRWRRSLGKWLDAPPALGHGAVFVADQAGRVYAVVGE